MGAFATNAKATWARLIRKVYEADRLVCPECKGPMRVIALIDDPGVVRRILEHLGRWVPEPAERGPPAQAPDWPPNAVIPFTYHAVPDITAPSTHAAQDSRHFDLIWIASGRALPNGIT